MIVSVIGSSSALPRHAIIAEELGSALARHPRIDYVVCGGMGGIMEAVCKGVHLATNTGAECKTIGILPGNDKLSGNQDIDIPIVTGMGFARNIVVALTGDIIIAIGGSYGTLSELGHSLSEGRPVIALVSWDLRVTGEGETVADKSRFLKTSNVGETLDELNKILNESDQVKDI